MELQLSLSAIKLPARRLICDYGLSATWNEFPAKLIKAIGISWARVKNNTCLWHLGLHKDFGLLSQAKSSRPSSLEFEHKTLRIPHCVSFSCLRLLANGFRGSQQANGDLWVARPTSPTSEKFLSHLVVAIALSQRPFFTLAVENTSAVLLHPLKVCSLLSTKARASLFHHINLPAWWL